MTRAELLATLDREIRSNNETAEILAAKRCAVVAEIEKKWAQR